VFSPLLGLFANCPSDIGFGPTREILRIFAGASPVGVVKNSEES